jgi:hypothetical protein
MFEDLSVSAIETQKRPYFISNSRMNKDILRELLPLHEAWAGIPLIPSIAYGLRVYRNGSSLNMHVDRRETHIISSILHVDHDHEEGTRGWPIVIEDFQGNTNEIYLESGDMLLYESSKCFHGRPTKIDGSWYASLFLHYYPLNWDANTVTNDIHYRIPPSWMYTEDSGTTTDQEEELVVVSTSLKEPNCEHQWCSMADTMKWYGPAPGYGKVISASGVISDLPNILSNDKDEL